MPISYQGSAFISTAGTTYSIPESLASPANNDVRLIITQVATTATVTVPTGWTTLWNDTTVGSTRIVIYYRVFATGVGTQTFTFSASSNHITTILNLGNQVDLSAAAAFCIATGGGTSGTTLTAPSLVPSSTDGMLLNIFHEAVTGGASACTLTTPGGFSTDGQEVPTGTQTRTALACYQSITSPAATSTSTSTSNTAATTGWTGLSIFVPAIQTTTSLAYLLGSAAASQTGISVNASTGFSLGTEFTATAACWVTAIRYYKQSAADWKTPTGRLYTVSTATTGSAVTGTDVTFTGQGSTTVAGWKTVQLATPIALTIGQVYRVAAYFLNGGSFTATNNYWSSGAGASDIVNGPLTAYSDAHATGGIQGSFVGQTTGTFPVFPTSLGSNANYWVDVVVTTVNPFSTPITGTTETPTVTDASSISAAVSGTGDPYTLTDSSSVAVSASTTDSASVTESSSIKVSTSDSGTLTDSSALTFILSTTDTSSLTDSSAVLNSSTRTDSATATEASKIGVLTSDSASLTESSAIVITTTTTDSASLTDVSLPINTSTQITGTDSGTATEVSSYTATSATTDSAALTEVSSATDAESTTDSATLTESSSVQSTSTRTDNATLTDVSLSINTNTQIVGSETYTVTESPSSTSVTQSRTDSAGITAETSSINDMGADSFSLIESSHITVLTSDNLTVTESSSLQTFTSLVDSFTFTEESPAGVTRPILPAVEPVILTDHADVDISPAVTDDVIVYKEPRTPKKDFRVIAQDHFTRQFIHWDLPLDNVQITYSLTGPNLLTGQLSSEMESIMTLDPPLVPDRTWLHLEEDGEIRASFILTPFLDNPQTQVRTIEGEGFSVYPHWIVYEGDSFTGVQVDPADMIRKIWDHVQSFTDGNLGVVVSQTKTPVKLGEPPESVAFTTNEGVDVSFNAGPYTLNFWSVTNCGDEIDKLCQQTPIDYLEYSYWNASKTDVVHKILLGYPRVGTKRTDLAFREGENLSQLIPSYQGSNDNYASDVIVIGAGTGPGSVRAISSGRIGLLRKTNVIQNQDITNHALAQTIADFEFKRIAHSRFLIQNITVDLTNPNALWGSFAPGDDILVQGTVDYVGYIQDWYRITSYVYDPYLKIAAISLSPSDSFTYGSENVDPYSLLPTAGFATLGTQQDFSSLFASNSMTQSLTQLQAYVTQTVQQELCDYFNKHDLQNGMAIYWRWVSETPVPPNDLPTVFATIGPLSDLTNLANFMIMGKTDYGHLITGTNIVLISKDGTIGQLPSTTSDQVYPNPYYLPDPSNTDTTPPTPSGLQEAAADILDRLQSGLPINVDFSWDGEPFIVSQYNDTLFEKYNGYANMRIEQFLVAVIYGQIQ